jgi:aryl-alcohol dehydrogenase-like predicted oxidoreductase
MDFNQRVPFGRTGLMVSRMGLASGYGVPTAGIEKAFHEYGVNYLYVSPLLHLGKMAQAVHNLANHRDELVIVLARPFMGGMGGLRLENFVERWLKKLKLDRVDLLLQGVHKPLSPKVNDRLRRLAEAGKVRFLGMSSHQRTFFRTIDQSVKPPVDFIHVRYNAIHTGAEEDVFPHLPQEDRPGVAIYTATCWRKLLKRKPMPDERPLTAADCYRFVLSHPDVNVCLTGPSTSSQMEDNLKALTAGPLNKEAMTRIRRIGKHIYGKK